MPQAKRRRATDEDDSDGYGGSGAYGAASTSASAEPKAGGNTQVLPVADLPDDFDGEAEDGATYLALAARENEKRPFVTRVDPPTAPVAILPTPAPSTGRRHPVLPHESWPVVFAAHFAAYRATLAKRGWPPTAAGGSAGADAAGEEEEETTNDPAAGPERHATGPAAGVRIRIPAAYDGEGWVAYVDGTDGETDMELDEEEALNAPPPAGTPREPLVSVLRDMDTHTILAALEHLTPTTALPPHRAQWLFAMLAILDAHLDSDQLSALRTVARGVVAFIGERYLAAHAAGSLAAVPVYPGFYAGDTTQAPLAPLRAGGPVLGEVGCGGAAAGAADGHGRWTLGAARKRANDHRPRSEAVRPESAGGRGPGTGRATGTGTGTGTGTVDDELARAWLVVFAIVSGWAQHDLVDEFERALWGLPLP